MKGYQLRRAGSPQVLKLADVPDLPAPSAGQVQIRTKAIGLNYAEVLSRKGQYSWAPKKPYTIGMEAFGEVVAVGEGVTNVKVGDNVMTGGQYGAYAEYVNVPSFLAFPAFPDFSDAENAAVLVNYMTAWIALFCQARVKPGETVLVQAAAGGVGTAAVQLLKALGCTVIAMASKPEKIDLLNRLGADLTINYAKEDFYEVIMEKDMRPDIVLELVGGDVFKKSYALLKPFGRMVVAGFASIPLVKWNPFSWIKTLRMAPKAKVMDMAKRSIGMYATHIGYLIENPQLVVENFEDGRQFMIKHGIRPVVGKEFNFDQVPEAHAFMESRKSYGKVVINVPG